MELDKEKTKVVFKVIDDEVIAVFTGQSWTGDPKDITTYMHIGQHSGADKEYMESLPLAKKDEYMPLFDELTGLGYNLEVENADF